MNEARRMHYLEAMGVDMYVPRLLLSNALASQECELPIATVKAVVAENTSVRDAPRRSVLNDGLEGETLRTLNDGLNSVLSELELDSKPKARAPFNENEQAQNQPSQGDLGAAPAAKDASAEGARSAVEILERATPTAKFKLNLWFADSGVQVLDSCVVGDALPTESLLRSVLQNTGLLNQHLPPAEVQVWPFPGSSGDQSWSAASSMINDFFQYRFEQRLPQAMIIFGEDAAKAVLGESVEYTKLCQSITRVEAYAFPILILPALRDFLYEPKLKKSLWVLLNQLKAQMPQ